MFFADPTQTQTLPFGHDLGLVALSVAIAVIASVIALQVATLARSTSRLSHRVLSIGSGAVALGGGVWAMHFVGMLGFDAGMPLGYRWAPTALSWALPLCGIVIVVVIAVLLLAVGGGTPTYLSAGQLERVLVVASELFKK